MEEFKMRFKRASAALLAAALAVPAMSITAFAEEDAAMKKALTYVKQRIDIPGQCSEFNYSTRSENNGKRYTFTWTLPDDTDYTELESGTVTNLRVDITGSVIKNVNINRFDNSNWKTSFGKLSEKELIAAAKKITEEINPTIKGSTVIDEDKVSLNLYGDYAYVAFHREVNGIPVTGQNGSVALNKNTGELISYSFNWTNGASFTKSTKAISEEAAQEAYKSLFGSQLNYTVTYDWEKKEFVPHLLYTQTSNGQINAFTGKLSTFEDYDVYENGMTVEEAAMDDADMGDNAFATKAAGAREVTFSDAEIKKLEDESKLISAKAAIEALSKYDFLFVPAASEVSWENCSYDQRNGYYVRNVNYTAKAKDFIDLSDDSGKVIPLEDYDPDYDVVSGSFRINAETGELLSYYCYISDTSKDISDKAAKAVADKAAKTLLGDTYSKFGTMNETNRSTRYLKYDPETGKGIGTPITTTVYYQANREEYGINCQNEYYNITVASSGYVTNFSKNYYADVKYPDPKDRISADEAYEVFFRDAANLSLRYHLAYRTEDKKVVSALVYAADKSMSVDALSGKAVNYDGSEIIDSNAGGYTDIENSKYKKYAETLAKYGITLMDESGRLNESEAITAGDLIDLMNNTGMGYVDISATSFKKTTKLNRQNAAVLAVTGKYGKEVAELTSAFRAKFSDVSEKSIYLGYVAIADAAGWITGSGDKFSPKTSFTRGEALKMVYTYLSNS